LLIKWPYSQRVLVSPDILKSELTPQHLNDSRKKSSLDCQFSLHPVFLTFLYVDILRTGIQLNFFYFSSTSPPRVKDSLPIWDCIQGAHWYCKTKHMYINDNGKGWAWNTVKNVEKENRRYRGHRKGHWVRPQLQYME
jgi:hypothetical protein